MSGYYDTAQVCRNGHVVTSMSVGFPEFNRSFCKDCGEPTLTACEHCQAPVPGFYHHTDACVITLETFLAPAFCAECGKPYPWTETRLEAARELAYELDLEPADAQKLRDTVDDLVKEGPKTELAVQRAKRILAKASKGAGGMFVKVLTDMLSETAKKALSGP